MFHTFVSDHCFALERISKVIIFLHNRQPLKSSMSLVGWSSKACCCAHNFGFVAFLCCCSHNFAVVAFLLVILVAKRRAALYIVIASGVTMVDRALPVFKRLCFQRKILLPHLHSLAFSWLAITLGTCQLNTKYNTLQSAGRYWTGFKAEKYYERLSRSCVSPAGEYFVLCISSSNPFSHFWNFLRARMLFRRYILCNARKCCCALQKKYISAVYEKYYCVFH